MKKIVSSILAFALCFSFVSASAVLYQGQEATVIPLPGEPIITEVPDDGYNIEDTPESIAFTPSYSVEQTGKGESNVVEDVTEYLTNRDYKNSVDFPVLTYAKGEETQVTGSISVSGAAKIKAVKAELGASVGKSHTVTSSTSYFYKIPYRKKGCIYLSTALEFFTFKIIGKDSNGKVVSTDYGSCTRNVIAKNTTYNIRLISI